MENTGLNAEMKYLTPENIAFDITPNGFVTADVDKNGEFKRVYLSRIFPHDLPEEYISVTDAEGNEYGIIKSLAIFDSETAQKLRKELERRYFSARIVKIVAVEEKFGSSTWIVETAQGKRIVNLRDTFKSIIRVGDDRAIIVDEDANRYEIDSLSGLDRNSYRRIELYL